VHCRENVPTVAKDQPVASQNQVLDNLPLTQNVAKKNEVCKKVGANTGNLESPAGLARCCGGGIDG